MTSEPAVHSPKLVIEAGRAEQQYWRDLWRIASCFTFWRGVTFSSATNKTAIGVAWALIRPLLTMLVFTVIFSRLTGLPSAIPYALLVFSALLPWQFSPRRCPRRATAHRQLLT